MSLSDTTIKNAKPEAKDRYLSDGHHLYLLISKAGGKLWRMKYKFNGKGNWLTLGAYPAVSLQDARGKRNEACKLLAKGIDPSADKKRQKVEASIANANTLQAIADEFIEKRIIEEVSESTITKTRWFLTLLGDDLLNRPISEIEPFEIVAVLDKLKKRGNYETAKRVRAFVDRVFRYAIGTSRAKTNPASQLSEALVKAKPKSHAAIIDPVKLGQLLRDIDTLEGNITTVLALKLNPHVYVRPGELRHAEWSEFDFEAKVWRIPAGKMKMRSEHVVPLSTQSINILMEAREVSGSSKYVFPSIRTKLRPMSENTITVALRRLGYTGEVMTGHGFRTTASSLLNESTHWSPDAIERSLAHNDTDTVRGTYNRSAFWDERVRMAQWWSDYLDDLRKGAT